MGWMLWVSGAYLLAGLIIGLCFGEPYMRHRLISWPLIGVPFLFVALPALWVFEKWRGKPVAFLDDPAEGSSWAIFTNVPAETPKPVRPREKAGV
jgi:hypothetical protein